jgi:hypothetical protein
MQIYTYIHIYRERERQEGKKERKEAREEYVLGLHSVDGPVR